MSARRYIAVVQAPEGYPPPGAPLEQAPSVPTPVLHAVVLAGAYDELRRAAEALLELKDGPRDDAYQASKESAWARLRMALTGDES